MKKIFSKKVYAFLILVILCWFGVANSDYQNSQVIFLSPQKSHSFRVEVVEDEVSRAQGLMYRRELPKDAGMLFVFEQEKDLSFWMKNTYIPLDIIFINNELNIVKIHRMTKPFSEESLPSEKKARYVVEINGGLSDQLGIKEGQKIKIGD